MGRVSEGGVAMAKRFVVRMRVRLDDVDYVQVLYFPRVAHLCCVALEDFFREALGLPWPQMVDEHNVSMPTVDLHVTYKKPLRFGEEFDVEVGVRELGRRKAVYRYELRNVRGEVTGIVVHTVVFVRQDTWEPIEIPAAYRAALEGYVG